MIEILLTMYRTRAMERKLRDVELIDLKDNKDILELTDQQESL